MSVPNTNTFTLQDVVDEINVGGVNTLDECFDNAIPTGFDPAYEGNKDRLSNFRNYSHDPLSIYSVTINDTGYLNGQDACDLAGVDNLTLYYEAAAPGVTIGTILYTNSGLTTTFNGLSLHYLDNDISESYQIDGSGEVILGTICGGGSSSTQTITGNSSGQSTYGLACGLSSNSFNLYFSSLSGTPAVNDYVYTNIALTIPFNGLNKWYFFNVGGGIAILVNTVGRIVSVIYCNLL